MDKTSIASVQANFRSAARYISGGMVAAAATIKFLNPEVGEAVNDLGQTLQDPVLIDSIAEVIGGVGLITGAVTEWLFARASKKEKLG